MGFCYDAKVIYIRSNNVVHMSMKRSKYVPLNIA